MSVKKYLKTSIALALIIAIFYMPGLAIALNNGSNDMPQSGKIDQTSALKIDREVTEAFKENDLVEVLIMLEEKADTKRVADLAKRSLPLSATVQQRKMQIRYAVVSALQQTAEKSQAPIIDLLKKGQAGGEVEEFESFYVVNTAYARLSSGMVHKLAGRPEVSQILLNSEIELIEPVSLMVDQSLSVGESVQWNIERIGAPVVWDDYGIDGSGVVVGIIDTGVDWQHQALIKNFRGYNPTDPHNPDPAYNWLDLVGSDPLPRDISGHGTHVTGIIMGKNHIGVAPGARWIAARAFTETGATQKRLIAAGEYMLAPWCEKGIPNPEMAPDIINNSWGGGSGEWYRQMVQSWRAAGILPVFAAGNDGPGESSLVEPGIYPESLAVAATDIDDKVADFSSRGPAPYSAPDDLKPDISAPGVNIRSAMPGGIYDYKSGTSMAAPHVSGVAALLLFANPELGVDELEELMLNAAEPLVDAAYPGSPNYAYGAGMVNSLEALFLLNEDYGKITGQVLDGEGEGKPLEASVTVIETGRSVKTSSDDGSFNFYHPTGQDWTLLVESYGYISRQFDFKLESGETLDFEKIFLDFNLVEFGVKLRELRISEGILTPAFNPEIASYRVTVDHEVDSVEILATPFDGNAIVKVTGKAIISGESVKVYLNAAGEETIIDIVVTAAGNTEQYETYTITINRTEAPGPAEVVAKRLYGDDRYQTAISIAKDSYPEEKSADAVVIARGDDFADALPGGVLAFKEKGPLLLTRPHELIADVETEIKRVLKDDGSIYILGGSAAISSLVEKELEDIAGYTVERIEGKNRTETAYKVAQKVGNASGKAIIAYSHNFPDALAISSYAAREGIPILTSGSAVLSKDAKKYLADYSVDKVYVVGGPGVISKEVYLEIEEIVDDVERLGGDNRYDTARLIAGNFFTSPKTVVLAFGRNFPDALAGGVNAAKQKHNAPILLVEKGSIPATTKQYMEENRGSLSQLIIYGGPSVVSDNVIHEAKGLIE